LAYQKVRTFVRLARRRIAVRTSGPQRVKCAIGGPDSLSVLVYFRCLLASIAGRAHSAGFFRPPRLVCHNVRAFIGICYLGKAADSSISTGAAETFNRQTVDSLAPL